MNRSQLKQTIRLVAAIVLTTSAPLQAQSPDAPAKASETIVLPKTLRTPAGIFAFLNDDSKENQYARMIAYGQWDKLNTKLLKKLDPAAAQSTYRNLLKGLAESNQTLKPEERLLTLKDVIALSNIAPAPLTKSDLTLLGQLAANAIQAGYSSEELLQTLAKGTAHFGKTSYLKKKNTCLFLLQAGLSQDALRYLPDAKLAMQQNDAFIVALHLQQHNASPSAFKVESSIALIDWVLNQKNTSPEALARCRAQVIELFPRLTPEQRRAWLKNTRSKHPQFLNNTLTDLYRTCQKNRAAQKTQKIVQHLTTAKLVFTDLLQIDEEENSTRSGSWKPLIEPFSLLWLNEWAITQKQLAQISNSPKKGKSSPNTPSLNFQQLETTFPLTPQLAKLVNPDLKTRLDLAKIQLLMKLNKMDEAFEMINRYSATHPVQALALCDQLLTTWSNAVNPNLIIQAQGRSRSQKIAIPLTRIRQIENIKQLQSIYAKIKSLKIGDVSDRALVSAFARCHSQAETYTKKDIEAIFGPAQELSKSRLITLVQDIKSHIHKAWTDEKMQKSFRTGRSKEELKQSLEYGYNLIISMISDKLKQDQDYQLHMILGSIYSNWAKYEKEQAAKNNKLYELSDFSKKIELAFENYEAAITLYQQSLAQSKSKNYDISPYLAWFNLLLENYESSDLTSSANLEQWGLIKLRKQILATPHPKEHMTLFGKATMKSLSKKSKDKKAYIDAALIILQDTPTAEAAKKYQNYYRELVQEIQLVVSPATVALTANNNEIGIIATLRHTDKISHECHGFYKFIAPASNGVDYRSDFSNHIRAALDSSFNIKSITFSNSSTRPRPLVINGKPKKGWSETPLAYILVERRAPSVDKIPSFSIDIPFYDFDGQVTIPFNSNEVSLTSQQKAEPTTPKNLKIFQTLNTRTRDKNTVSLEIRATANGVIPPLRDILDLQFKNFKIVDESDEQLQVNTLVNKETESYPETERNWTITLSLPDFTPNKPTQFHFPTPKDASVPVEYHQYQDADLVSVDSVIDFNAEKMESSGSWIAWLLIIPVLGLIAFLIFRSKKSQTDSSEETHAYHAPESLNPFTCAALLLTIQQDGVIKDEKLMAELKADIQSIEASQFSPPSTKDKPTQAPDYKELVNTWLKRANSNAV